MKKYYKIYKNMAQENTNEIHGILCKNKNEIKMDLTAVNTAETMNIEIKSSDNFQVTTVGFEKFLEQPQKAESPLSCPQTSILNPYKSNIKSFDLIYPNIKPETDINLLRKKVYLVTMNCDTQTKYILKYIRVDAKNRKKLDNLAREFYIGKMFGALCPNVAKPIDMKQTNVNNGADTVIEMLIEYGGDNLYGIINKLNNDEFVLVMEQLINTLVFMEEIGIAHFDIKPLNIVYDYKVKLLKIIDFGTSISFQGFPQSIIENNIGENIKRFTGFTETYTSPEVLKGYKDYDSLKNIVPQKVDVFCFGITFVEILLLVNKAGSLREISRDETKVSLENFIDELEKRIISVKQEIWLDFIKKCLEYNPSERPTFKKVQSMFYSLTKKDTITNYDKQLISQINYKRIAETYFYELQQYDASIYFYEKYLDYINIEKVSDKESICEIYVNLAVSYAKMKNQDKVEILLTQIYPLLNELSSTTVKAQIHKNLGKTFEMIGEHNYAIDNLIKSAEVYEKTIGPEKIKLAEIYNELGLSYLKLAGNLTNHRKAIEYFEKSIKIFEINLLNNDFRLAICYYNLSNAYGYIWSTYKDLEDKSEIYLSKAWEIFKKSLGEDNIELANFYHQLGQSFTTWKKYDPKMRELVFEYYMRAIEIYKKQLGEDHPDTGNYYFELAEIYINEFRYNDKAIECYQQALKVNEKIYQSYDFERVYQATAWCYDGMLQYDKSVEYYDKLYSKILERELKSANGNPVKCGIAYRNNAFSFSEFGLFSKSLECYDKAMEYLNKAGTKNLSDLILCYYDKGLSYILMKEPEKAIETLNIALEKYSECQNIRMMAKCYHEIGKAYNLLLNYESAIWFLLKAIDILERPKNDNREFSDEIDRIHLDLAISYLGLKLYDEVLIAAEKAELICNICLVKGDTLGASFDTTLGYTHKELKNYKESIKYFNSARNNLKQFPAGMGIKDLTKVYGELAELYKITGNLEKSEKCLKKSHFVSIGQFGNPNRQGK